MGFGFWWAWVYLALLSPALSPALAPPPPTGAEPTLDYLGLSFYSILSGVAFFAVAMAIARVRPHFLDSRAVSSAFAAITTLSTFAIALSGHAGAGGEGVFVAGSIASGIGISALYLLWGSYYSRLQPASVSSATLVSFLCALLIARLSMDHGTLTVLITALLPLLSVAVFHLGQGGGASPASPEGTCPARRAPALPERDPLASAARSRKNPLSWKVIGLIVVFCFMFGLFRSILSPTGAEVSTESAVLVLGSSAFLGCVLLLVTAFFSHSLGWEFAIYLSLPLIAAAALVPSLFDSQNHLFVWAFIVAAVRCSDLIMWNIFANGARQSSRPAIFIFAYGKMVSQISVLLGMGVGGTLLVRGEVDSLLLPAALLLGTVLVVFATLASTEHAFEKGKAAALQHAEAGGESADPLEQLAADSALSARETEIFLLLARGRTIPYIAERLGIADSTVTTHARSIYKKTGVHTRQELIDYADRTEGQKRP